jgi:uncharacterized protein YjbI with pentapeptide repeats
MARNVDDTPSGFEQQVAQIYLELGARVEHDKNVGGVQVDVYAVQCTPDGSLIRTAIECKRYARAVGVDTALDVCRKLATLRGSGHIDKGVLVSSVGITQDARTLCDGNFIQCFTLEDLKRRIADLVPYLEGIVAGEDLPHEYKELIAKNAFVSLASHTEGGVNIESVTDYIENWLMGSGQLLTILGEYGSGKTTTSLYMAQKLAAASLRGSDCRLPILIDLKRFNRSFTLRTYLTDFLLHQQSINIRSFSVFEKLNREGRFVLIFDAFDEMATHAEPAVVFKYLDEILSLQEGNAKVLLTCRTSVFKDQADLDRVKSGTDLYSLLHKHVGYQVLFLDSLTEEQLQHYLSCHYGDRWTEFYCALSARNDLRSLAERPILLNMIVSTIHSAESLSAVNTSRVYTLYTDIWVQRDNWRCHLRPEQRKEISEVLAYKLVTTGMSSVHHRELLYWISDYFSDRVTSDILDQYAHEVRTCTFLRNDMQGFYSFVHRSFAEFFTARYMLGQLARGVRTVLLHPVSLETYDFLAQLIENESDIYVQRVWGLLRDDAEDEESVQSKQTRAIAAYLLLRCGQNLSGSDLSGVIFPEGGRLDGATLSRATCVRAVGHRMSFDRSDLSFANLQCADLRACSFKAASLASADCREANLSEVDLSGTNLRSADFRGAQLDSVVITPGDVERNQRRLRVRVLKERLEDLGGATNLIGHIKRLRRPYRTRRERRPTSKLRKFSLEAQLDRIIRWSSDDEPEGLNRSLRQFTDYLEGGCDQVEEAFELQLARIELEITHLEAEGYSANLVKEENRKRQLRHVRKSFALRRQYILGRLQELILESAALAEIAGKPNETSTVVGAKFWGSTGLSRDQTEWLERNGAVVRRPVS